MKPVLRMAIQSAIVLGVISLNSCSDDDDDGNPLTSTGSCTLVAGSGDSTLTSCLEYPSKPTAVLSSVESECEAQGASSDELATTWASDACSTTNSAGSCAIGSGTEAYTIVFLDGYSAEVAESSCIQQGGAFTAAS